MNHKSKLLSALLLLFTVYSCTNNDEEQRPFPRVKTLEVSNITDEGAVFNGFIEGGLKGNDISDHGFYYGYPEEKAPLGYTKVSLGKLGGSSNSFHAQVSGDLLKDKTYSVMAFVELSGKKIYGTPTSFISKGGLGPEIKSFNPQTAGWGDTINIRGTNFSKRVDNNIVKFDKINARIISASDTLLKVIVPEDLITQKSNIGVTTAEKTFLSMQPFLIGKPLIKKLTEKVPFGGILNVKTQNVNGKIAYFFIDGNMISSSRVSLNEYNIVIPMTYNYGAHKLKIEVFSENSESSFHYDAPVITDFTPKRVRWYDKLTITGKNFKSLPSNSRIDFLGSNSAAYIFSVLNDSVIQLKMPQVSVPQCKLGIASTNFNTYSFQQLSISGPELEVFAINQFCVGEQIILEGKRMYSSQTLHCFDGVCENLSPSFIDSTHLLIDLPINLSVGRHQLTVKIGELQSNPVDIYIKKLIVNSIKEDFSCRNGRITLQGENFGRYPFINIVKIGGIQAECRTRNENSLEVILPTSTSFNSTSEIVVSAGPQQVTVPDKVEIIEPWQSVSELEAGFVSGAKFTIGNKFFFSTGNANNGEFYCYNADNNTWKKIADYPGGRVVVPICFVIGQNAFVGLGKKGATQKFWKYDSESDRWNEIAECPLTISTDGWEMNKNMGFAFVHGQFGYVGNTSGGMYKYDSLSDQWKSCKWHGINYAGNINIGFNNGSSCFHFYGNGITYNKYDPNTDSWKNQEWTNYSFRKDMYAATYIEKLNRFLFDGYIYNSSYPSGIQYFDLTSNEVGFFFPSISLGATLFSTVDGRLFAMTYNAELNKVILYRFDENKYEQVKNIIDRYGY